MLFLPFKVDLHFNRIPIITVIICLLCVFVFMQQQSSNDKLRYSVVAFCEKINDWEFELALEKIYGESSVRACSSLFAELYFSRNKDEVVAELVAQADDFDSLSEQHGKDYLTQHISRKIKEFDALQLSDLTSELVYRPQTLNVVNMITSAFSHGSWSHLIGNLFFFFAFAASVEMVLGRLKYVALIFALVLGTDIAYSLSVMSLDEPASTLGLSGVVMGMIGVFAYLMPTVNIKCFLWFIVIVRILAVPAWLLALWYVGWDIYELTYSGQDSQINFVAHVSGAFLGFLFGLMFLRENRSLVQSELVELKGKRDFSNALDKNK